AAHANPVRYLPPGQELAGPVRDALPNQREAGNSDDNGLGFECFGYPVCGEALARSAWHDESASWCFGVDEVIPCSGDCPRLMRLGVTRLWFCTLPFQSFENQAPVQRPPAVETNLERVPHQVTFTNRPRAGVSDNRTSDVAAGVERER